MVEDWKSVVISGVIIAIPISILANLLTTPVQNWLDTRLKRSSERRESRRRATFATQAAQLASDRTEYMNYLFEAVLRTTYIGALFGVVSGLIFAVGNSFYFPRLDIAALGTIATVVGQLVGLIGSILVINIARGALQMIIAVRGHRQERAVTALQPAPTSLPAHGAQGDSRNNARRRREKKTRSKERHESANEARDDQ